MSKVTIQLKAEDLRKKLNLQDGKAGKDGHTPTQDELEAIIKPLIPEPIAPDVSQVTKDSALLASEIVKKEIPTLDTPTQIVDKLETLQGDARLNKDYISGLDDYDEVARLAREPKIIKGGKVHGGSTKQFIQLLDVPNSYANSGGRVVAVKQDGTGLEFISPFAWIVLGEIPTVTNSGSDALLTLDNTPLRLTVSRNGQELFPVSDYSVSGNVVTVFNADNSSVYLVSYTINYATGTSNILTENYVNVLAENGNNLTI